MTQLERPIRILLAQPHPSTRKFLTEVLEDEGYDVIQAGDEADLQEDLSVSGDGIPFDVVIAAVNDDGGTGLEVLEDLREYDPETPFVLLNWGDDDMSREARALGAVVLDHPFDVEEILAAVEDLVEERRLDETAAA